MGVRIFGKLFGRLGALLDLRRRFPGAKVHYTAWVTGVQRISLAATSRVGRHTSLQVHAGASLSLAQGAWLGNDCEVATLGVIVIGAYTTIQHRSQILGDVAIGAGCVCAANLYVSSAKHAFDLLPCLPIRLQDRLASQTDWTQRSRPVSIGDDCWIGINVVILPGVTIGRGCVIGANSVVSKDLPPYTVAAGAPARALRQRLEFIPPAMLDASNDFHLPYFYAGFSQLEAPGTAVATVARQRGGLTAEARFAVALQISEGQPFSLDLELAVPGSLRHGATIHTLPAGVHTVQFDARPDRWQILTFEWSTAQAAPHDVIVVKRVQAEPAPHLAGAAS